MDHPDPGTQTGSWCRADRGALADEERADVGLGRSEAPRGDRVLPSRAQPVGEQPEPGAHLEEDGSLPVSDAGTSNTWCNDSRFQAQSPANAPRGRGLRLRDDGGSQDADALYLHKLSQSRGRRDRPGRDNRMGGDRPRPGPM
jgi:hypothetical protein